MRAIAFRLGLISAKAAPPLKRTLWLFGATMVCFGLSDLIEIFTGAWYRPLGLLLLKAGCVGAIAYCFWVFFQHRKVLEALINGKADRPNSGN